MSFQDKKSIEWFVQLKPGDKVMLYQPKNAPLNELSIIKEIIKNYDVTNAFYTKISINSNGNILDYHLIGLNFNSRFPLRELILELDSNLEKLKNIRFFDLSENSEISNQIKKMCHFIKNNFLDYFVIYNLS